MDFASFDEVIETPWFTFGRSGRFWVGQSNIAPEDHEAFLDHLWRKVPDLEKSIEDNARKLAAILAAYDPLDLIANFTMASFLCAAQSQAEIGTPTIPPWYAEYLAVLALKKPYPESPDAKVFCVLEEVGHLLDAIAKDVSLLYVCREADPSIQNESQTLRQIRLYVRTYELQVRGPAYPWHYEEVLRELFEPFNNDIEAKLKFGIHEALALTEQINLTMQERLWERGQKAREEERILLEAVSAFKRGKPIRGKYSKKTRIPCRYRRPRRCRNQAGYPEHDEHLDLFRAWEYDFV